ncbi:hypothetical protein PSENEW3_00005713 [Picochlorum sp. SENEW3]|nr:hypothetical protein PSENEW3_00005713 [Picochlorum sp. SENEW3]
MSEHQQHYVPPAFVSVGESPSSQRQTLGGVGEYQHHGEGDGGIGLGWMKFSGLRTSSSLVMDPHGSGPDMLVSEQHQTAMGDVGWGSSHGGVSTGWGGQEDLHRYQHRPQGGADRWGGGFGDRRGRFTGGSKVGSGADSDSWRSPASSGQSKWQEEPSWRAHPQQHTSFGNTRGGWRSHHREENGGLESDMRNLSIHQQSPLVFGTGGGRNGNLPFGPSKARYRYSTDILAKIYRQLLYTGRLGLPEDIARDDPDLFTRVGEFVDVVEQLHGGPPRSANSYINLVKSDIGAEMKEPSIGTFLPDTVDADPVVSHVTMPVVEEPKPVPVEDTYLYIDPQGQWQGPFNRSNILEWHAAGFFPLDLVIQCTSGSQQVCTLRDWLLIWSSAEQTLVPPSPIQTVPAVQVGVMGAVEASAAEAPVANAYVNSQSPLAMPHEDTQQQDPVNVVLEEHHSVQVQPDEFVDEPVKSPIAPVRPETKPAPWVAAQQPDSTAISLLDIQLEEDARRREVEKEAAQQIAKSMSGKSGWASVAKPAGAGMVSLTDIQNEELQSRVQSEQSGGAFWKYDEPKSPLHGNKSPVSMPAKAAGGWAAALSSGTMNRTHVQPSPTVTARRATVTSGAPPPPPPPPPPATSADQTSQTTVMKNSDAEAIPSLSLSDVPTVGDGHPLTGEFRTWCMEQMKTLTGSEDVTLCEFLMTVESNSEVADYVAAYLGATAAAATFSSEFLRRKLAELAAGTGKKSRKARAKARAKAAAAAAATASPNSARHDETHANDIEDSSWEKVEISKKKGKGSALQSGQGAVGHYSSAFAVLGGR